MFRCQKCDFTLDKNAKFCTNCGESINQQIFEVSEDKKDMSWLFLLLGLFIGIISELYLKKIELGAENMLFFNFISILSEKAQAEFYAEIFGAGMARVLIPSIIVGFIWGIKSMKSKKYEKPILHIFIGTIIVSVIPLFNAGN